MNDSTNPDKDKEFYDSIEIEDIPNMRAGDTLKGLEVSEIFSEKYIELYGEKLKMHNPLTHLHSAITADIKPLFGDELLGIIRSAGIPAISPDLIAKFNTIIGQSLNIAITPLVPPEILSAFQGAVQGVAPNQCLEPKPFDYSHLNKINPIDIDDLELANKEPRTIINIFIVTKPESEHETSEE